MGLFGSGDKTPVSGYSTPVINEPHRSIDHPTPKPTSGTPPPAPVLTAAQQQQVASIIRSLSDPGYALPTSLASLKGFWKARTKSAANTPASTPAPSPVFARTAHTRDATDASVVTMKDDSGLQTLSEREKFWLTNEQIQRCCRAVKWDQRRSLERIEETLVWRREYGTEDLTAKDVWEENETGKQYIYGFDKQQRPIQYMHPDRQNTKVSPNQIKHVVYQLERTVDLMPPGVENLCLCIDFGAATGGGQPTSIGQARTVLHILQTYYCERLGRAVCTNVPTIFWAFYKLIQAFIDPVTKDKIRFVRDPSEVLALIDAEYLTTLDFGGKENVIYDKHNEYFAELDSLCKGLRQANFERWQQLCGSEIGASEFVIKGGKAPSSSNTPSETPEAQAPAASPNGAEVFHDAPVASAAALEKAQVEAEDKVAQPALVQEPVSEAKLEKLENLPPPIEGLKIQDS